MVVLEKTDRWNPEHWDVKFSPKRDVCIITRERDWVPECYPLYALNGKRISLLQQVGDREFVYLAEFSPNDDGYPGIPQRYCYRVELVDRTIRYLESFALKDEHRCLYTKKGVKAYEKLLQVNQLTLAEPEFGECSLKGYRYDTSKYEIKITPKHLIVEERKTGDIRICETKMECLGFRLERGAILGIFRSDKVNRDGKKRLFLMRFQITSYENVLTPCIGKGGSSNRLCGWSNLNLELFNMNCQIDKNRIYTKKGQYLIKEDWVVTFPCNLVHPVVAKREEWGRALPLALVTNTTSSTPVVLALMDPYDQTMQKKALNLATNEVEEIKNYADLNQIEMRTLENYRLNSWITEND